MLCNWTHKNLCNLLLASCKSGLGAQTSMASALFSGFASTTYHIKHCHSKKECFMKQSRNGIRFIYIKHNFIPVENNNPTDQNDLLETIWEKEQHLVVCHSPFLFFHNIP